jgi:hypothetical protein
MAESFLLTLLGSNRRPPQNFEANIEKEFYGSVLVIVSNITEVLFGVKGIEEKDI